MYMNNDNIRKKVMSAALIGSSYWGKMINLGITRFLLLLCLTPQASDFHSYGAGLGVDDHNPAHSGVITK